MEVIRGFHPDRDLRHVSVSRGVPALAKWRLHSYQRVSGKIRSVVKDEGVKS